MAARGHHHAAGVIDLLTRREVGHPTSFPPV
jgi:hypothetical protein